MQEEFLWLCEENLRKKGTFARGEMRGAAMAARPNA
jgi:hypothetical protein